MERILDVRDVSADKRGGRDPEIQRVYNLAVLRINAGLRNAFVDEGLSKLPLDLSYLAKGLSLYQLSAIQSRLVRDCQHAGWEIETFPYKFLKFIFYPPIGSL